MRHCRDADNLTAPRIAEAREQISNLRQQGYGPLIDAIANPAVLTAAGTIKAAAVARIIQVPPKAVIAQLRAIRMAC